MPLNHQLSAEKHSRCTPWIGLLCRLKAPPGRAQGCWRSAALLTAARKRELCGTAKGVNRGRRGQTGRDGDATPESTAQLPSPQAEPRAGGRTRPWHPVSGRAPRELASSPAAASLPWAQKTRWGHHLAAPRRRRRGFYTPSGSAAWGSQWSHRPRHEWLLTLGTALHSSADCNQVISAKCSKVFGQRML